MRNKMLNLNGPLYLKQLLIGPMENHVYLLGDGKTKECFAVDPAWDVESILEAAKKDGMKVIGGLLTHTHFDHANGCEALVEKTGGKIYVNKHELSFVKDVKDSLVPTEDGGKIKIGAIEITCLHTPGHTPGGQCFLVTDPGAGHRQYLLSGDTLFIGACGRCDLPGSSPEKMYESLMRLGKLADDVVVLPGHHYDAAASSTIGQEKSHNPYYQCRSREEFLGDRMGG